MYADFLGSDDLYAAFIFRLPKSKHYGFIAALVLAPHSMRPYIAGFGQLLQSLDKGRYRDFVVVLVIPAWDHFKNEINPRFERWDTVISEESSVRMDAEDASEGPTKHRFGPSPRHHNLTKRIGDVGRVV